MPPPKSGSDKLTTKSSEKTRIIRPDGVSGNLFAPTYTPHSSNTDVSRESRQEFTSGKNRGDNSKNRQGDLYRQYPDILSKQISNVSGRSSPEEGEIPDDESTVEVVVSGGPGKSLQYPQSEKIRDKEPINVQRNPRSQQDSGYFGSGDLGKISQYVQSREIRDVESTNVQRNPYSQQDSAYFEMPGLESLGKSRLEVQPNPPGVDGKYSGIFSAISKIL